MSTEITDALFEKTKNHDKRPIVDVTWEHHKQVDAVFSALTAKDPKDQVVFRQGGALICVEGTPASAFELETATLHTRMSRAIRFVAPGDDGLKQAPANGAVVLSVLKEQGNGLPELLRVVNAPFYSADGNLVLDEGYHAESKTYCDLAGFQLPRAVPSKPTAADMRRAKSLILDTMLHDFPFEKRSDRVHALAFGLEFYSREMINGPLPMHSFEANIPRSGKGKLMKGLSYPALGDWPKTGPMPRGEQELAKNLLADLMTSPSLVAFDNIRQNRKIEGDSLETATTEPYFNVRVLGISKKASPRVRCGWVLTANNPQFSPDMAARTLRSRLVPKDNRPELRDNFKIDGEFETWVQKNRPEIVWSFLTLIQNWVAKGMPRGKEKLGGFEAWCSVIGGILAAADIPGLLEDREDFLDASSEDDAEEWGEAVEVWWARYKGGSVRSGQLVELLCRERRYDLGVGDPDKTGADHRMGKALKRVARRSFNGLIIDRHPDQTTREGKGAWVLRIDPNSNRKPDTKTRTKRTSARRLSVVKDKTG